MSSTAYQPEWDWPQVLSGRWTSDQNASRTSSASQPSDPSTQRSSPSAKPSVSKPPPSTSNKVPLDKKDQPQDQAKRKRKRTHWPPRTCRICLETVHPTVETPSESLPSMLQGMPSVSYVSEDGGRLIRPCLCKGSQRYVHEGCLQAWRLQDPSNKRNYWQCPTCKYSYHLERMTWAHRISSTTAQVALTVSIFLTAVFILGYVADPIINTYLDPLSVLSGSEQEPLYEGVDDGWVAHFAKGFASLGLLGFAKFLITLSPWQYFSVRNSLGGGRGGTTGRDRMQSISWIAVAVGVVTFLWVCLSGYHCLEHPTDCVRLSGKVCAHGAKGRSPVPLSGSWTYHWPLVMTTTTKKVTKTILVNDLQSNQYRSLYTHRLFPPISSTSKRTSFLPNRIS